MKLLHGLTALFLISGISLAEAAPVMVQDLVHVDADLTSDHKDPKSGPAEIIDYKLKLRLTNGYSVQVLQGGKIIGEKLSSDRFRPESDD